MKTSLIIIWRIYFWFILAFVLLITIYSLPVNFLGWISKAILTVSLVGLFMFVYQKPFLSNMFWKLWFCLHMLREVYEIYFNIILKHKGSYKELIIGIIIALPTYLGLFLYGFRSTEIWAKYSDHSSWSKPEVEAQKANFLVRPILEKHLSIMLIASLAILLLVKIYAGSEIIFNSSNILNLLGIAIFSTISPVLITCIPAGIYWLSKRKLMPAFYPIIWISWITILYFYSVSQINKVIL